MTPEEAFQLAHRMREAGYAVKVLVPEDVISCHLGYDYDVKTDPAIYECAAAWLRDNMGDVEDAMGSSGMEYIEMEDNPFFTGITRE